MAASPRFFRASLTELEATGLLAVSAQSVGTGKSLELAQEELARPASAGAVIGSLDDPAYPVRLKEIYDPPPVLYVRGDVNVLAQPGIAVVGTRHPTPYGSGMAERLSIDLTARGLIIISGMARGVDSAAHRGAIAAKGKTIAVFGTGVDVPYPKENSRLAEQIFALGGALITEFPMQTFPAPQNFPIRNRIISGMSMGVLVVEAAEYSGTRITARCALEFLGPEHARQAGRQAVATWEDVWDELPENVRLALAPEKADESPDSQTASLFPSDDNPLSPHERKILALLKADEATQIDEIVERLEPGMSSSEIFAALFELELAGKVRQLPGKNFVKSF